MEKIGDTLNKLNEREGFQDRFNKLKKEILEDPDVLTFIKKNQSQITNSMIDKSLGKLYEFISQSRNCKECPSLEECKNIIPGYEPQLVIERNGINVHYTPCRLKILDDERRKADRLIQCIHMPKEILDASMSNVIIDTSSRINAIDKAEHFIAEYNGANFIKGLYFHGPFGTGKTFLLGAIANELADKNISSLIVYVPEFIREMKQSIQDNTVNEKIEILKKAPVLMFDDIGAETVSSWVRDEILGPILQYRMLEKLPTFFTSNFTLKELEHHLTYSQRGEEEKMKAARIIERIQFLAEPILLDGENRRLS